MNKFVLMVVGGVLALILAFGGFAAYAMDGVGLPDTVAAAVGGDFSAGAVSALPAPAVSIYPQVQVQNNAGNGAANGNPEAPRGPCDGSGPAERGVYLADQLGITVEDLEAAYNAALLAALDQAVAAGLITPEQAEAMLSNGLGSGRMHLPAYFFDTVDFEALLAAELGISKDDLIAARLAAAEAHLAQLVADGKITQEQADAMLANFAENGFGPYGYGPAAGFGPGDCGLGEGYGPGPAAGLGTGEGYGPAAAFGPGENCGDCAGYGPGAGFGPELGPGPAAGYGPGEGFGPGEGCVPGEGYGPGAAFGPNLGPGPDAGFGPGEGFGSGSGHGWGSSNGHDNDNGQGTGGGHGGGSGG